ncbi:MAG: hypothetical protein JOZ01_04855 [Candidatus Eremiobacteraeota bacterium]|nr:hypothetical protein [Candidatus Eremiobacteraeota bacterium]
MKTSIVTAYALVFGAAAFLGGCGTGSQSAFNPGSAGTATIPISPMLVGTHYIYTGETYKKCGGTYCSGGPYALHFNFTTSLTGSELDSLSNDDITTTVTSYKFTDGSGLTISKKHGASFDLVISTDASGNITAWFAGACLATTSCNTQMQTNWHSTKGFVPGADFSETTLSFKGSYGFIGRDPGTWSH